MKIIDTKDINDDSKTASIKISYILNQNPIRKRNNEHEAKNEQKKKSRKKLSEHDLLNIPKLISIYESIPIHQKHDMLKRLMHKSSRQTQQFMNTMIQPILKHDFLSTCPVEISRRIIGYLDAFSLAHASCVCKKWKWLIDQDENAWKRVLLQDEYTLMDPIESSLIIKDFKRLYARHHTLKMNWRKGRAVETSFPGHDKFVVTCLQFDHDKIVSGSDDHFINIYSISGQKQMTLEGHEGGVWALQYVDHILVTGSTDRKVRVWDMDTGKCTHIFSGHTSTVRCLLIVNGFIITGSRDATLRVWKLPEPKNEQGHFFGGDDNPYFLHALIGHRQSVRSIAAHNNILVSGSYDHTVRVWDINTGRIVHILEGHSQKVYSVVIDPKRNVCMSGSLDSNIRIWDLETGNCIKKLEGHSVLVGLLGISPTYLVSAAADASLRIWSPETGVCEYVLSGHENSITCFQLDSHKIISGSEGGLKMWDIRTGKFLTDLVEDVDCVWRVAFDGRRCVAAIQKNNETSFRILDFGVYNM